MTTPLSHSTRRVLFAAGVIHPVSRPKHESDVMPYVPLAKRAWDADSETFQPVRVEESN